MTEGAVLPILGWPAPNSVQPVPSFCAQNETYRAQTLPTMGPRPNWERPPGVCEEIMGSPGLSHDRRGRPPWPDLGDRYDTTAKMLQYHAALHGPNTSYLPPVGPDGRGICGHAGVAEGASLATVREEKVPVLSPKQFFRGARWQVAYSFWIQWGSQNIGVPRQWGPWAVGSHGGKALLGSCSPQFCPYAALEGFVLTCQSWEL